MAVNTAIIRRKSIRKYTHALTEEQRVKVQECIQGIKPLTPCEFEIRLVNEQQFRQLTSGMFVVKAPDYAMIYCKKGKGCVLNAGYVGQMLALGLTALDIGTCWLGGVKQSANEQEGDSDMCYMATLALGNTDQEFRQTASQANRKKLESIAEGDILHHMDALEAASLAPSAMNIQPVRYIANSKQIHVFRKNSVSFLGTFDKLQTIDSGIAIANIVANNPKYTFSIIEPHPILKGAKYVGTLTK